MTAPDGTGSSSPPFALVTDLRLDEGTGNRADQVAHQLQTAITLGLLARGERLPPEPQLAEQLGVTLPHLRQALAILREDGLISTRRGRGGGSSVCDTDAVTAREVERRLRGRSTEDIRDLGDLAGAVAAAAARLAAERADAADLGRIRHLARQFAECHRAEELRQADSRFHIGVAVVTRSRRLVAQVVQVQAEVAPLLWSPGHELAVKEICDEAHTAVVEAIADTDADAAARLALRHSAQETEVLIDARLDLVLPPTPGGDLVRGTTPAVGQQEDPR